MTSGLISDHINSSIIISIEIYDNIFFGKKYFISLNYRLCTL